MATGATVSGEAMVDALSRNSGSTAGGRDAAQVSPTRSGSPTQAPYAARSARRRGGVTGAIWSGLAGFVLGAVFWHLVGFWSFVSHVVFKGPDGEASAGVDTGVPPSARRDGARTRDYAKHKDSLSGEPRAAEATITHSNCSSLDRSGRGTRLSSCADRPMPTWNNRGDRAYPREDLATTRAADAGDTETSWNSTAWTVQVDSSEAAANH